MNEISLYPLRFEPIYQNRLWGGRRLANLLTAPLPGDGPIGEAWLLSDREDHPSRVADGPLKGRSIGQLLHQWPEQLLGKLAGRFRQFPLLLKFLDVRDTLSVQVHPSDRQTQYIPAGETGKTEAWVVLEAGQKVAFTQASSLPPRLTLCGRRSRTERWRTSSHPSFRSPATEFSFRPEPFIHWATWWSLKCRKTAT